MDTKINKKKYLLFIGYLFVLIFFSKIFITLFSKSYVKNNFINEYILSKYSKEIRYDQFYLLNNNKDKLDTYLFCTSACLAMDPDLLVEKAKGFNMSIGAGQVSDYLKYFKWILKNREKPKKIFIGLEYYSLSDFPFMKSIPHEVEENNVTPR